MKNEDEKKRKEGRSGNEKREKDGGRSEVK